MPPRVLDTSLMKSYAIQQSIQPRVVRYRTSFQQQINHPSRCVSAWGRSRFCQIYFQISHCGYKKEILGNIPLRTRFPQNVVHHFVTRRLACCSCCSSLTMRARVVSRWSVRSRLLLCSVYSLINAPTCVQCAWRFPGAAKLCASNSAINSLRS